MSSGITPDRPLKERSYVGHQREYIGCEAALVPVSKRGFSSGLQDHARSAMLWQAGNAFKTPGCPCTGAEGVSGLAAQVAEAVCLEQLSYHEAWELSYFGANVLHPRTTLPAMKFRCASPFAAARARSEVIRVRLLRWQPGGLFAVELVCCPCRDVRQVVLVQS